MSKFAKYQEVEYLILQPSLVEYRLPFYEELSKRIAAKFVVIAGDVSLKAGVGAAKPINEEWFRETRNIPLLGGRFLWQRSVVRSALAVRVCVINVNPRILSSWVVLLVRCLLRRPTVGWGHLFSSRGARLSQNLLRFAQYRLCGGICLYTQREVALAPAWMQKRRIVGLQNSSVREEDCRTTELRERMGNLIFVGRLEADKKIMRLIHGFSEAASHLDPSVCLMIVGRGSEEARIREEYSGLISEGRIQLMGWIWDNDVLFGLYQRAAFSVSPGYVGLNVIQSFAFGVPMIVSRNEPHSPEIAACRENFNAAFFDAALDGDLAQRIREAYSDLEEWNQRREAISSDIHANWTVEKMADRFAAMLEKVL